MGDPWLSIFAFFGVSVALIVGGVALLIVGVWVWAKWPVALICSRDTPTNLDMPGRSKPVNLLLGLVARGKDRWFFGLMLIDKEAQEPRRARTVTTKDRSHA